MSLLQQGEFTLSSGKNSSYKIDCDFFTDEDIKVAASLLARLVLPFSQLEYVPTGGLRLYKAMEEYKSKEGGLLLVDDVLTTGGSLTRLKGDREAEAVVLVSRGWRAYWVYSLFTIHSSLWGD